MTKQANKGNAGKAGKAAAGAKGGKAAAAAADDRIPLVDFLTAVQAAGLKGRAAIAARLKVDEGRVRQRMGAVRAEGLVARSEADEDGNYEFTLTKEGKKRLAELQAGE